MRVRIPDPNCRMCDGTGTTPDSYMGARDSRPCLCGERVEVVPVEERDRYIRAFNRLEKAVTNHVKECPDADGLAHAHKKVVGDLRKKTEKPNA